MKNSYDNVIANTGSGTQSIAQGNHAIGTQINNYYASPPQDAKPHPAPAAKSGPPTVVVDAWHRGDYVTITEALEAVKPGTRILVRPGLYKEGRIAGWRSEGIVIDKPVEIIGDGDSNEIVVEFRYKAVLFQANVGRIANLTLRETGGEYPCVEIVQGRLEMDECDISSQSWECVVAISNGADPRLRRCRIHGGQGAGVEVSWGGRGTLEDNEIFANALSGVAIMTGGNPILRHNVISHNRWCGIWVVEAGGCLFEDNDLRGNNRGAYYIAPNCEANVEWHGNKEW